MSTIGLERRIAQQVERRLGLGPVRLGDLVAARSAPVQGRSRAERLAASTVGLRPGCDRARRRYPVCPPGRPTPGRGPRFSPGSRTVLPKEDFRAHVLAQSCRHHPPVARHRCRRSDPRPARDRDRDAAARQAQADLGAARRHRRPRDRHQRVEARVRPAQGAAEAVPPSLGIPGRDPHREPRAHARAQPREGRAARRAPHASEGSARSPAAEEAAASTRARPILILRSSRPTRPLPERSKARTTA